MSHRPDSSSRPASSRPLWPAIFLIAGSIVSLLVALLALYALLGTDGAILSPSGPVPATSSPPTATRVSAVGAGLTLHVTPIPRPDVPLLQQFMLALINEDRRARGLTELVWDRTAAQAGLLHAQEMARFGYVSHWNLRGQGPDYRYSLVGGTDTVRENVYRYQYSPADGPVTVDDWKSLVRRAQRELMDSPGHRDNILAREHTHVGIGIACGVRHGWLVITQEFVGHYLTLQPLPRQASVGDVITVAGELANGLRSPTLNLAYEPLPSPRSAAELSTTGGYSSAAQVYAAVALAVDDDGRFERRVGLDYEGRPGLYHVRIWGDTALGRVLAADVVLEVR